MTDFGLSKKSVIVTGGAGGLGRAFAQGFIDAGAYVAIADVDEAGAKSAASALGAKDKQCIGVAVDVTDETSVARLADRAREAFGGIDVLVNNAAIYGALTRKPFFEITAEDGIAYWASISKERFSAPKRSIRT
jgi:NAD(P)-dependent dehydrogenase (short-subunit alcohol dehydrogenase family)